MRQAVITAEEYPQFFGIEWPHVLVRAGLCRSMGEARRLIRQGGIKIDGEKAPAELAEGSWLLSPADDCILSRGRRRYVRVIPVGRITIEVDDGCAG